MTYDVYGMCNPLFDIQVEVSDETLAELGYEKGGMFLIDEESQRALVAKVYTQIVNSEPGGSGANTMIGLAQLGGTGVYTGKVGNDDHGKQYKEGLEAKSISLLSTPGDGDTGICVVLITPDAQRTLCTFLGMCRNLGPDDVDVEAIAKSKYLYVTSYLWDTETQQAAVLKAMKAAKEAGVKVALSLSDPFCVDRHHEELLGIVKEYADVLIGNADEAQKLTGAATPQEAAKALLDSCELAVVTMDSRGSLLCSAEGLVEVPSVKITPVDTTGAGDMYAAGLLYGLTHGLSLEKSGAIAAYVAAMVVAQLGPRLDSLDEAAVAALKN